ncbi:MAG: dihydrofolate reductase family protein [Nocardioidaceae bacterium]|nr:dihydrofolate reductase family protein [Nocardioidaceae bacterium]
MTSQSAPLSLQVVHGLDDLRGQELSDADLLDAYPWPESGGWVRAMMVTTLDGAAAGSDTVSKSLTSKADQRVFRAVRRFADAVLVGAQTIRSERYTPMKAHPEDGAQRAAAGQLPAPTLVVASRSLDLPWDLPVWSSSAQTPIVLTGHDADEKALDEAKKHADVVQLERLRPADFIATLQARGLRRINCEGGPRLLHDLVTDGCLDEADITVAPLFAGTGTTPDTPTLVDPARGRLVHVLLGDDNLITRYLMGAPC